ncbi:MAG TPA: SDR family oxidoreductase [Caulobacteraceae bacterium]|nr:SDR family oxidoreductase [Caulobacteraceae bacterium]
MRGWALVTGAGRRIGRALALAAAEAGFDVRIHVRVPGPDAEETCERVRALGRRAVIAPADLADTDLLPALVAPDGAPVTLLVNSASLFDDDRIASLTPASLDAHYQANLRAPVLLAQAFAAALPPDRGGHIVNIVDQRVWRLTPQFFSYTLSKAALWTATQTLAQALAPRIRVNAIGPGPTLPSIHQSAADFAAEAGAVPLQHGASPEEIAAALAYLIDAGSVTGQMIAVDGGQHLAWKTPDIVGEPE